MKALKTGICAEKTHIVTAEDTARRVGSGSLEVFGTPCMLALMEEATCLCIADYLEQDETTVGTGINIAHLAPTPVGKTVVASAVLSGVDGRQLIFEVTARDEHGEIGRGEIKRCVVYAARFMEKTLK